MSRAQKAENVAGRANAPGVSVQFVAAGALFVPGVLVLGLGLTGGMATVGTLAGLAVYVAALLFALRALRGYPHRSIGLCNVVTVFRLMLVSGLIAALVTPGAGPWAVFGIAALALLLDGVDGWLARRAGHVSTFGGAFDMEVDAGLALVLALLAFFSGQVDAFILLLGLPRYIFWIAQFPFPWLVAELPARFSRKVVCVAQISVLIAVLVPFIERPLSDGLAGIAALLLIWSFAVDIRWLRQAHA